MTLRNGIKKQLEKRKEQQGSYLVEAALTLPVFIISVTALILITTIISICEDVSFVTALEMRDINMQVYNQTKSISLCNRLENSVLKNCKKI